MEHQGKLINMQSTEVPGSDLTNISRDDFPEGFVFGTSSSAYQFEGAAMEGGRGPSIWDAWTASDPSRVADNSNGNVAIDQYHKYKDDVKLMKKTGFDAYRFSISWSRILPGGRLSGGVNQEGIKYYNNLIDELLSQGLEPYATLFHFDPPLALELEYGGLLSEKFFKDYLEYVELCFWEFGDRVKNWITFNEPHLFINFGYVLGLYPPGRGSTSSSSENVSRSKSIFVASGDPGTEPYLVAHHLILAHANAVESYRKKFAAYQGGRIGITLDSQFYEPLNDTEADRKAATRALDFELGWFVEPLTRGDYPQSMRDSVGDRLPKFSEEESKLVKDSYDFLGINYYTTSYATNAPKPANGAPSSYTTDREVTTATERNNVPIGPQAASNWLYIVPRGIYEILIHLKEYYNVRRIYITENGVDEANNPSLTVSESLNDEVRIKFYHDHLQYLKMAINKGVNVEAYFAWSFADDFEFQSGYTVRFGLFYIDFLDGHLTRYPKTSAIWWANFLNKKLVVKGTAGRLPRGIQMEEGRPQKRARN